MKVVKTTLFCALFLTISNVYAVETEMEERQAEQKELERDVDKVFNRLEESTCVKSDAECAGREVGNRASEATDAVKDTAEEVKDKVD